MCGEKIEVEEKKKIHVYSRGEDSLFSRYSFFLLLLNHLLLDKKSLLHF